jgi:hypothetical protein
VFARGFKNPSRYFQHQAGLELPRGRPFCALRLGFAARAAPNTAPGLSTAPVLVDDFR